MRAVVTVLITIGLLTLADAYFNHSKYTDKAVEMAWNIKRGLTGR